MSQMAVTAVLLLAVAGVQQTLEPEATSLLEPLFAATLAPHTRPKLAGNLAAAKLAFDKDPARADAAIWLGRRTACLGRYREANWHLHNGKRGDARGLLHDIVERNGSQWAAFGYIAAEADLARLR